MSQLFSKLDFWVAQLIHARIRNPALSAILGKINKGEVLVLVLLPIIFYRHPWQLALRILLHVGLVAFITDRSVLVIKKYISRKRPLLQVMDSRDPNPDMKHSFPSAHAANSMVVVTILIFSYGYPPYLLAISLLAGIGRLCTLHHFISDVLFGWLMGFCFAILSVYGLQKLIHIF